MNPAFFLRNRAATGGVLAFLVCTAWGAEVPPGPTPDFREVIYHGLRLTDPGGRNGLPNPERGWRTETMIAEPHGRHEATHGTPAHLRGKIGPEFSELNWVRDIQRFAADGVTVGQMYCYLTDYADRPLPMEKLFEYLRDHLGYRLELKKARFPQSAARESALAVELELVNRGFAAPVNPRQALLTLIAPDEKTVLEFPIENDPRRWQPYQPGDTNFTTLTHRLTLVPRLPTDLAPGTDLVGLWLPDAAAALRLNPRYAIRLANRDTTWWTDRAGRYGINLLGTILVKP